MVKVKFDKEHFLTLGEVQHGAIFSMAYGGVRETFVRDDVQKARGIFVTPNPKDKDFFVKANPGLQLSRENTRTIWAVNLDTGLAEAIDRECWVAVGDQATVTQPPHER